MEAPNSTQGGGRACNMTKDYTTVSLSCVCHPTSAGSYTLVVRDITTLTVKFKQVYFVLTSQRFSTGI